MKPMVSRCQGQVVLDTLHPMQDLRALPMMILDMLHPMHAQDLRALTMMILYYWILGRMRTFLWIIQHHQFLWILFPMLMLECIWEKILMVKSMAYPTYVDLDGLQTVLKR